MTWADIVRRATRELNLFDAQTAIPPDDAEDIRLVGNAILDQWNAIGAAVWGEEFATYQLTASLSPQVIGPTGNLVVAQRPQSIDGCALVVGNVDIPVTVRDSEWYQLLPTKALTSNFPTDLYYEQDFPNGSLFFWPIPSTARTVRLMTRVVLGELALTDTFTMAPGYRMALELTLAEAIAGSYGKKISDDLKRRATEARAVVYAANDEPVRLGTRDIGVGGGTTLQGTYRTGWFT